MPISLVGGVAGAVTANEISPSNPVGDCKGDLRALGICDNYVRSVTGFPLVLQWVAITAAVVGVLYGLYLFCKGRDW
jgi:hypothetical protein